MENGSISATNIILIFVAGIGAFLLGSIIYKIFQRVIMRKKYFLFPKLSIK
jgi:hypothetical protein